MNNMIATLGLSLFFIGLLIIDANIGIAAVFMFIGIAFTLRGLRNEK